MLRKLAVFSGETLRLDKRLHHRHILVSKLNLPPYRSGLLNLSAFAMASAAALLVGIYKTGHPSSIPPK